MMTFLLGLQPSPHPHAGEAFGIGAGCFICVLWLLAMVIGIGAMVFWIWALVDCLKNEPSEGNDKIVWTLVIVLLHWIGALIYVLVRRPQRLRASRK